MSTTIAGADSLNRKLRELPDAARRLIAPALEQSAQEVVNLARDLAPHGRTGELRDSIDWQWGGTEGGSSELGTVRLEGRGAGNLTITIFAGDDRAFYARWIEFGTAPHINRGRFRGSENPGTRARPFFFPAYRAVRKKVKSRVSRAVTKSAKQVAGNG